MLKDVTTPNLDPDSLAKDRWILAVPVFPEAVAQNRDWRRAGCLIGRRKIPSEDRSLADQLEAIGADDGRRINLWKVAAIAESNQPRGRSRHSLERRCLGPPVLKI